MPWIWLVPYVIGYAFSFRPLFRRMYSGGRYYTAGDLVFELILCALFNGGWPVIVGWWGFEHVVSGGTRDAATIAKRIAGESRQEKLERLEQEKKDRERYIASLERELKIGEYTP